MDYKLKARFLSLYSMILADGIIDAREMERSLICKYAKRMGFIEENINDIVDYLLQQAKAHVPISDVIDNIMKEE